MPTKRKPDAEPSDNELCCCPPRARIWLERRTEAVFVENEIDMRRRLMVRADANTSIRPPSGPDTNADGSGGSQLDEGTLKKQGKVHRIDHVTIHWRAEGQGDLRVRIHASGGSIDYDGDWMPDSGSVTVARSDLLEPPYYGSSVFGDVTAAITVEDCCGSHVRHTHVLRGDCPARKPVVRRVSTTRFARGRTAEVTLSGEGLGDVSEVHVKVRGIEAGILDARDDSVTLTVNVAPDAAVGSYDLDAVLLLATQAGTSAIAMTGAEVTVDTDDAAGEG